MSAYKKIMIIDDSEMDLYILKRALNYFNLTAEIVSFQSPQVAYNFFKNIDAADPGDLCPEIIFLDINMPGMSGFQFLEEFKKLPLPITNKCKFIITSSSGDIIDRQKSGQYKNVIKYLVKPIDENLLTDLVG